MIKISNKIFLNFFHIEVIAYWLILSVVTELRDLSAKKPTKNLIHHQPLDLEIPAEDIIKIQASDHYVKIFNDHKFIMERMGMTQVQNRLGPGFKRVHRSWIVNEKNIKSIEKKAGKEYLKLSDGSLIPIGKSFRKSFRTN